MQKYGGGAGIRELLTDPTKMKELGLTQPDIAKLNALAGEMTQLNNAVSSTSAAQQAYDEAVRLSTGKEKEKLVFSENLFQQICHTRARILANFAFFLSNHQKKPVP